MPSLAIAFPEIDPIIVQLGPFAIRWYALAYIAGLVLGWRYILRLVQSTHLWPIRKEKGKKVLGAPATPLQIDDLLIWVTLGVVLGGRAGYVLFYNPGMLLENPLSIFAVWQGGMSFHGGLLGVIVGGAWFCVRNNLSIFRVGDLVAAAVPIGLFFGRIANFINQELWGNVSNVPWAVIFPKAGDGLGRHPSQLYEAGLEGILLFVVLYFAVHKFSAFRRPGLTIGMFLTGYGLSRIFVEFFRTPDYDIGYLALDFVTLGMILSLPMVIIGLGLIWRALDNAPSWLRPEPMLPDPQK